MLSCVDFTFITFRTRYFVGALFGDDDMRTWKDKLTSRKFWAAVIGVSIALMILFGVDSATQEKIVALITASATLIAYILAEGNVDAFSAKEDMFTSLIKQFSNTNNSSIPPAEVKEGESVDNKG